MSKQDLASIIRGHIVLGTSEEIADAIIAAGWTPPKPEIVYFKPGDVVRGKNAHILYALGKTRFIYLTDAPNYRAGDVCEYGYNGKIPLNGFNSQYFELVEVPA